MSREAAFFIVIILVMALLNSAMYGGLYMSVFLFAATAYFAYTHWSILNGTMTYSLVPTSYAAPYAQPYPPPAPSAPAASAPAPSAY